MVRRTVVLSALLAGLAVLSAFVLAEVLATVVFAITVAYMLYPLRQQLVSRGVSHRLASGISTGIAFVAVLVLFTPIVYILYQRRRQLVSLLDRIPETISVAVAGSEFVVEMAPIVTAAEGWLRNIAITLAAAAPRLALELVLFTIVVYGLLYRPTEVRRAAAALVPEQYHDIVARFHRRTRETLFGIYILQLTTAIATFLLAAAVFWVLGYEAPFSLALVAGILQFIPIVGPSVLVVTLALNDIFLGNPTRAGMVLVLGLFFVSFLPDAVIRTKLAERTGRISSTLYFVGFVGGILTLGMIGVIVGPLVVALLAEVIDILSDRGDSLQTRL